MLIAETAAQAAERQARWAQWIGEGEARDRSRQHAMRRAIIGVCSLLLLLLSVVLTVR